MLLAVFVTDQNQSNDNCNEGRENLAGGYHLVDVCHDEDDSSIASMRTAESRSTVDTMTSNINEITWNPAKAFSDAISHRMIKSVTIDENTRSHGRVEMVPMIDNTNSMGVRNYTFNLFWSTIKMFWLDTT